MIGKIIGAFVGDRLAKQTGAASGAGGAALGVLATTLLRRMSLPAMVALGVGGYAAKKYLDKQDEGTAGKTPSEGTPSKTTTTPSRV